MVIVEQRGKLTTRWILTGGGFDHTAQANHYSTAPTCNTTTLFALYSSPTIVGGRCVSEQVSEVSDVSEQVPAKTRIRVVAS